MTSPDGPVNEDSGLDTHAETLIEIPNGSVILRVCEVVQFLGVDGEESIAVEWRGTPGNILVELGMLEYAKIELADIRLLNPKGEQ